MGFTTINGKSYFDRPMEQTQRQVYFVRNFAGYTVEELSEITGVSSNEIREAEGGGNLLSHADWERIVDACDERAFDAE